MKTFIAIILATLLVACASTGPQEKPTTEKKHKHAKFTQHIEGSYMTVTRKGLFNVEMAVPDGKTVIGKNTVDLVIHNRNDKDVTGAEITVIPWMPGMARDAKENTVIVEKGLGLYTVENIVVGMPGHWQLKVNIKWGDVVTTVDDVIIDLPHVGSPEKKYDYIRVQTPAGLNAVIGMKNPLEELVPEIINDNGRIIKSFTLSVKDTGFDIFPGRQIMGWGFDGRIPGPTIRVKQGDRIRVTLKNETSIEHTIHIHGQAKPVIADGVPFIGQKPVQKGEFYTFEFTVKDVGTTWYHCHVDSAHHVDMGMYGAFIVEPKEEKLEYDREYIMILDEWPTSHVHVHEEKMAVEGHDDHGVVTMHAGAPPVHKDPGAKPAVRDWYPKTYDVRREVYDGFTINGRSFPFTEPVVVKEGDRVRIRFINAGYQPHFMHSHSHKFTVVARDGENVDEPQKRDTVQVGPGQRIDIILLADNPGIWPFHCHRLDHVTNEHIYPGGMLTFIQYVK